MLSLIALAILAAVVLFFSVSDSLSSSFASFARLSRATRRWALELNTLILFG